MVENEEERPIDHLDKPFEMGTSGTKYRAFIFHRQLIYESAADIIGLCTTTMHSLATRDYSMYEKQ
jgi:hypothetical protein